MENIIYYLFLYVVVIAIRFFKLKNDLKEDFNKKKWEVFHISLEIVYTASGLVIALILNVPKTWIVVVFIAYITAVIVAALLEMSGHNFSSRSRTSIHVTIIISVVIVTIITFGSIIPKSDINGNRIEDEELEKISSVDSTRTYTVFLPYQDHSLNAHLGYQKMSGKYFYIEVDVKTKDQDSAVQLGLKSVIRDSLIRPLFPSKTKSTRDEIEFFPNNAIITDCKTMSKISL